jgi:hypothetical protein
MAAFIGDPNFPDLAMGSSRDGKVRLFQILYAQYSRMELTRIEDRPFAVAGLEKRLVHSLFGPGTHGGFGLFDDSNLGGHMLHRSLLWQRGADETTLARIDFPEDRQIAVPSWSWMGYKGGIDYMDIPFLVDWDDGIRPPWSDDDPGLWHTSNSTDRPALEAVARDLRLGYNGSVLDHKSIVYDIPDERQKGHGEKVKCVVVGRRSREISLDDMDHYVLLIRPQIRDAGGNTGRDVWERIGVACLPGRSIATDKVVAKVKIE